MASGTRDTGKRTRKMARRGGATITTTATATPRTKRKAGTRDPAGTSNPTVNKNRQGVQGVEVGLRLAFALAAAPGPLALRELARAAGLAPAKAHRYLVSLCRASLVEQDAASGHYDLGRGALALGLAAQARLDQYRLADEAIEELHRATGHATGFMVWGNRGPTMVRRRESSHPVAVSTRVGSVFSVTCSNAGRVFAAWMPAQTVSPLIEAELKAGARPTSDGRTLDRKGFERLLQDIRRRGLARIRGDYTPGVDALSAPVFDHEGSVTMVISVLGARGAIDVDFTGKPAVALARIAAGLSARLGFRAALQQSMRPVRKRTVARRV